MLTLVLVGLLSGCGHVQFSKADYLLVCDARTGECQVYREPPESADAIERRLQLEQDISGLCKDETKQGQCVGDKLVLKYEVPEREEDVRFMRKNTLEYSKTLDALPTH